MTSLLVEINNETSGHKHMFEHPSYIKNVAADGNVSWTATEVSGYTERLSGLVGSILGLGIVMWIIYVLSLFVFGAGKELWTEDRNMRKIKPGLSGLMALCIFPSTFLSTILLSHAIDNWYLADGQNEGEYGGLFACAVISFIYFMAQAAFMAANVDYSDADALQKFLLFVDASNPTPLTE